MTQPWAFGGAPPADDSSAAVTLIDGSTFVISDASGDVVAERPHGLFVRDIRVLSRWTLTVDGAAPLPLRVERPAPYAGTFIARIPELRDDAVDSALLVVRRRYAGNGMREDVTVHNLLRRPVRCRIGVVVDADFADLFEVKDGRAAPPTDVARQIDGPELRLWRIRQDHRMEAVIRIDAAGGDADRDGVHCWLTIPPRATASTSIQVVPVIQGVPLEPRHPAGQPVDRSAPARLMQAWRLGSPVVETADPGLAGVLRHSVEDIGALRIFDPSHAERAVVAAGAPWFMAVFGRDSLLTSWMVLPLDSSLALGTLQTLAEHQGSRSDPATEEEPGRILHEIRFGPSASLALGGGSVYYGSADATALFVMLLGELRRWGRADHEVRALMPHADRAMRWLLEFGDADGDGFVEYRRKTDRGLINQGWKDSWDGINFADGTLARAPIALAEVQAYTFAAYVARARLADEEGDAATAHEWHRRAAELKAAFNSAFWVAERGWYAIGLDADKRPIDALSSNIGHCLWTGIVDEDKAEQVADHLLSPEMFSGWGIRTLAASMGRYNPLSYHNGSVWPHDSAICIAGLVRYGFVDHAHRVADGLLDAAAHFGHRLPELFAGFDRADFDAPVPYPTACSPQAWAAAAPLLLLRTLLRLDPQLPGDRLWCAPAVPDRYLPLQVRNLRLGPSPVSIEVRTDGWSIRGLEDSPVVVTRTARPPS